MKGEIVRSLMLVPILLCLLPELILSKSISSNVSKQGGYLPKQGYNEIKKMDKSSMEQKVCRWHW